MTLSEFGTFHETLPLDRGAPVGTYRVRVYQPGKSDFAGAFEVQSYQLEPIDLTFDLKKTVFYRGETIEADVVARYQYGAPGRRPADRGHAPRRPRRCTARPTPPASTTSSFPTEGFAEEQALRLVARLPQDNVDGRRGRDAGGPRLRHRRPDQPRRLPRRRVVPGPGHDDRRPGRADRPGALGGGGQAGQPGGPRHRARGRAEGGRDRRQDGAGDA